ncbi:MAG: molybdopterin molybdotransferase MoeA [Deltaproteobacteria bacterium]|jgi:molybdopterin molybdotransferase|nr:molybdopterin molybdotransferase MoeA [Deltaproteobacteria bacterium]
MKTFIGFDEALELTLTNVAVGETEVLPLARLTGRILAEDIVASVDSPSRTSSRKDGFAVHSADLVNAGADSPVELKIVAELAAGDRANVHIKSGQAVRVTTGAPIPEGADAVLSEEFCDSTDDTIFARGVAEAGRNLLKRGIDIRQGEQMAAKGEKLSPPLIGLLACGGSDHAAVYRLPQVAVIASGNEVVAPGEPLSDGKLYASNMVEISSWLAYYGLSYSAVLVPDNASKIQAAIASRLSQADVFITSGGAWGSEHDLMLDVVQKMGWQGIYRRVRMGPGKPVAFGLLEHKPFFILPGGPPSNEMAFLQLALPAIMKMKGDVAFSFPIVRAQLAETVRGHKDWTQFVHARLETDKHRLIVKPAKLKSRLVSMARKDALIIIPEGREALTAGDSIDIQLLKPNLVVS